MKLLQGKPIADGILQRLKSDILHCAEKPGLAVVLVGNNEASKLYVALKKKKAQEIGMNFFLFDMAECLSEHEVIDVINKLNANRQVHGIIVQLPLPEGLDAKKIIAKIDPKKDADGFLKTESNLQPVFPHAIMDLIENSGENLFEKKAIVIANSGEFGEIMVTTLKQKNIFARYILSKDIEKERAEIKNSDIVVSAVGRPNLIKGEMLKPGCVVVDGGTEKIGDKTWGDVQFESAKKVAGFLSPVPGGVGPLTIAHLLENVYIAFKAQQR